MCSQQPHTDDFSYDIIYIFIKTTVNIFIKRKFELPLKIK